MFARLEFFGQLSPEAGHRAHDDDPVAGESHDDVSVPVSTKAAHQGRWEMPAATANASRDQHVAYTGAPSYNGGRNCGGGLLAGTRTLGNYLVDNFVGARYFQGYNCRRIRGGQGMSVHGTGRALDVFVPLDRGQADNDLGDPIANWLVEHAEEVGVQLIIWDRTLWSGTRNPHTRYYGGSHPHHDHLHIELTPTAAAEGTPFFGGDPPPPDAVPAPPPGPQGCTSATLGRTVPAGECVQMAYARCGGTCNWAQCNAGAWTCVDSGACDVAHPNAACAPVPERPRAVCESYTLGRSVPDGESVQMQYDACGGVCHWARCDDGNWNCVDAPSEVRHPHDACAPPAPEPLGARCYSRTLGHSVPDGDRVQMAYAACRDGARCNWAVCNDGQWSCTTDASNGLDYAHAACR